MSRLNSGNACYHFVQNLMPCCLSSKHIETKIDRSIILFVVYMGVKLGLSHQEKAESVREHGAEKDIWP